MCLPPRKGRCIHHKRKRSGPEARGTAKSDDRQSQQAPATPLDTRLTGQKPTGCEPGTVEPRWRRANDSTVHTSWRQFGELLPDDPDLERLDPGVSDYSQVPLVASRHVLEQAQAYDLVGYMEDDLLLSDPEFFAKILYLDRYSDGNYAFLPHRCEHIPGQGDVILSGDPDGGRPDLFWDTGEMLNIPWPLGERRFYRATNPHSGCYFLSRRQAGRFLNIGLITNGLPHSSYQAHLSKLEVECCCQYSKS